MLEPSVFYQQNGHYYNKSSFHQICMAHVCGNSDGSNLGALRDQLGYTSIAMYDTGLPHITKYLFARNNIGCEIHITPRSAYSDIWNYVGPAGVANATPLAGKVLARVNAWAAWIAGDVAARINVGEPIFIGGHGVGGAVASVVGELLKHGGKDVRNVYKSASPYYCDEDFVNGMQVWNFNWYEKDDMFANVPPNVLSSTMLYYPDTPPLPAMRRPGQGNLDHLISIPLLGSLDSRWDRQNPLYWLTWPNPVAYALTLLNHQTAIYIQNRYRPLWWHDKAAVLDWKAFLIANYGQTNATLPG